MKSRRMSKDWLTLAESPALELAVSHSSERLCETTTLHNMSLTPPELRVSSSALLEELLERMPAAEGVAALLKGMTLILRGGVVRVLSVIEALA